MGRILAIDFGAKRSGVAVTDSLQIIASPLKGMQTPRLLEFIVSYCSQEDVERVVIGYPTHADGRKTNLTIQIDDFKKELKQVFPDLPIENYDESYSSYDAKILLASTSKSKKQKQQKENLDMFAALVILRRYLNY